MTFGESVRTCFRKYADFDGCATRSEYWWWILFTAIASVALDMISYSLSAAFSVATLLPCLAVTSRRLHDTDRSGWLQLLFLIPIIGWVLIIIWCAQEGTSTSRYSQQRPAG
jgi:uncharacterized membrane protein YhaH (DUF805 family)